VRRAAGLARDAFRQHGLDPALLATGSKGYHLIAAIETDDPWSPARALHQLATLLVAAHPDVLTLELVIAERGKRVYLDWMRNHPLATVVVPYSLRARARATVAAPIGWNELDTLAPDAFTIDDVQQLLDRPDSIAALAPVAADPFVASVGRAFEASGLALHHVDRFGRPRAR
jgi:bifunctional non-homologous end joining protein LigD